MFRLIVALGAIAALAGCVAVPGPYGYGAGAPYAGYGGYDAYDTGAYPYYYGDAPVVSGGISIWGGGGSYRDGDRDRRPDRWHGGANAPGRNAGGGVSIGRDRIVPSQGAQMQQRRSSPPPARDNRSWGHDRGQN